MNRHKYIYIYLCVWFICIYIYKWKGLPLSICCCRSMAFQLGSAPLKRWAKTTGKRPPKKTWEFCFVGKQRMFEQHGIGKFHWKFVRCFFLPCWCDQHIFLCMILCVWCTFGPGFAGFWAGILMFRSFSNGFGGSTCVGDSDWLYSITFTCFNHQTRNQCVFCCSCHFLFNQCVAWSLKSNKHEWVIQ